MKKFLATVFTAMFLIGLLAACGSNSEAPPAEKNNEENENGVSQNDDYFPISVTDATGTEIVIEGEPERLISLVPSNTEIMYALGLFDKLIAVSDNDDFPEEAKNLDSIGGMDFDVEKIIALAPDLVLANVTNNEDGIEQIRNAGINVLVVNGASSFAEVYDSIEMVATLTGAAEKGEEVIADMKEKINEVIEKTSTVSDEDRVTVWVEIWPGPDMYTTGKGTFVHEMLEEYIFATNAAGDVEGWPLFTEEDAVILNPDVIITTYGHVEGLENAVNDVLNRPAWSEVEAVKNERVYNIEANLVERPGPRLVEGVEKLAKFIYPEAFTE